MTKIETFELPESNLLSAKTQGILNEYRAYQISYLKECAAFLQEEGTALSAEEKKQAELELFYKGKLYQNVRDRYDVKIEDKTIAGVEVEIFTPAAGILPQNNERVLINLHGGGFGVGSRTYSKLESIPVASLGQIKVVSVDYRMAPEHVFPAATDDAVNVYKELLKDHEPQNVGVYGSSAGGILTSQMIVRLLQEKQPLPSAVGMITGGAAPIAGDSVSFISPLVSAVYGVDLPTILELDYYKGADLNSPELAPYLSDKYMSAFPPSFLAASTRDFSSSSVILTHQKLQTCEVEADLHMWEGLEHDFHYNPDLPESQDLHRRLVRFFNKHFK